MSNDRVPFPQPSRPPTGSVPTAPTAAYGYYTPDTPQQDPTRKRRFLIGGIGIAAVLMLGLGGGAAWAMNAHGSYPYQYVAAGASAYAQLNMTPSMMERMQAGSFLSKIPKTGDADFKKKAESNESITKTIIDGLAPGNSVRDYSWAGDRFAVVAYGDQKDWSNGDDAVIVLETKDPTKAVQAIQPALDRSFGGDATSANIDNAKLVRALGGNYVAIGTQAALDKASTPVHLDKDPAFTNSYTAAGDPVSYWASANNEIATGSLRADWNSLQFNGTTTGPQSKISASAEQANKQLTAQNSVANPIVNMGLAEPEKLYGSASPTGKALLSALSAYTGGDEAGGTDQVKTQLDTILSALGDNVSFSTNDKNGRVLLHGTTEARVDAALTKVIGQKTTLRQLEESASSGETKLTVKDDANQVLITYGNNTAAKPADFNDVEPGAVVAKIDLERLINLTSPKQAAGKWGTVSVSVSTTDAGTKSEAKWVLP